MKTQNLFCFYFGYSPFAPYHLSCNLSLRCTPWWKQMPFFTKLHLFMSWPDSNICLLSVCVILEPFRALKDMQRRRYPLFDKECKTPSIFFSGLLLKLFVLSVISGGIGQLFVCEVCFVHGCCGFIIYNLFFHSFFYLLIQPYEAAVEGDWTLSPSACLCSVSPGHQWSLKKSNLLQIPL